MTQPSLKKRLLTGGSWVLAGKVVTATSTIVVGSLLSKMLSPDDFGVYQLADRIIWLATMLALLGLNSSIVRLVAESGSMGRPGRARAAVRMTYGYATVGLIVVGGFLACGGGAWLARSVFDSPLLAGLMVIVGVWAALHGLQVLTSETFRGFHDLRLATLYGGVVTGIVTAGSLLVWWALDAPITLRQVFLLFLGSVAASLIVALWFLARRVRALGPPEPLARAGVFSIALPLWVNGLLSLGVTQCDVLILGAFRPEAEVGVYGAAARLVSLVLMSLMLVNLVVPPFIAELWARGDKARLERMLRLTATVAGLPAFAVLSLYLLFGEAVLGFVYRDAFRDGATVLVLLSIGRLVHVLTGSAALTLSMTGFQGPLVGTTLVTTIIAIAGALYFVGPYGGNGVAGAIGGGVVLHSVAVWLMARYHTGMWTHVTLPRPRDLRELFESAAAPGRER